MNDGNVVSNEIWANLMGQEPAATIAMASECPERMTYADFMAMDAFLFTSMNMLFRNYELAREGIFSQSEWKESVNAYAGWYLANPFGRAWWEEEARQFFAEEFAQHVDTQLQRNVRDSKSYWSGIRVRLLGTESASAGVVSPACSRQSLGSR